MNGPALDLYAFDAFAERVRERFASRADAMAAMAGDHALNPDFDPARETRSYRRAAVLIAVARFDGDAWVLLTKRTEKLTSHSGQIAFPGGKVDPGETPVEAALREAHEEVGLQGLEVLGAFGPYFSGSGYEIVPVVALIEGRPELVISEDEVDDAFWVPLAFLMDQRTHRIESRRFKGNERFYYVMPYDDEGTERRIWGVTAGIVRTVQERLYGGAR